MASASRPHPLRLEGCPLDLTPQSRYLRDSPAPPRLTQGLLSRHRRGYLAGRELYPDEMRTSDSDQKRKTMNMRRSSSCLHNRTVEFPSVSTEATSGVRALCLQPSAAVLQARVVLGRSGVPALGKSDRGPIRGVGLIGAKPEVGSTTNSTQLITVPKSEELLLRVAQSRNDSATSEGRVIGIAELGVKRPG